MPRAGPKKIQQYSREFKVTAVRLSQQPGMQVQVVAAALDIHPFMLSRWRKAVRDGVLRGTSAARRPCTSGTRDGATAAVESARMRCCKRSMPS